MSLVKFAKGLFRKLLGIILILILASITFLVYQTLTDFKPEAVENLTVKTPPGTIADTLVLTTFNIGYCGLGAEMDFFYEGGTMVRPGKERFDHYLGQVMERISALDDADFILLQEVDSLAKRSWYANQYKLISHKNPAYTAVFALNYKAWVPMPLKKPMGKVRGGLLTLSRTSPAEAERVAFNSGYSWPMSLFMLKRCFIVTRYKTGNDRELVLVNTHNSAFSDAAEIREVELAQLKEIMESESAKGNYVIAGGDWNQNPAVFDSNAVLDNYLVKTINPPIPNDFLPVGWSYAYDPAHSTNRDVDIPYTGGKTRTTLIDFFVLSPDIELISVKTTPTGFRESDHQPVTIKVVLKH